MKCKKRIFSCILSATLTANIMPVSVMSASVGPEVDTIPQIDYNQDYISEELNHAYDPMSEIEAEQAEQEIRENAEIVENKIIFSVIDYRKNNENGSYINSNDYLCTENNLSDVSFVYETKADNYTAQVEHTAYEVFYEAKTTTDDVWSVVDSLKENPGVISAEPDFVWDNTAIGEYAEVTAEEYANEMHFDVVDAKNVWGSLNHPIPGDDVVVAVIDTGVDYNHKDLADNIWTNSGEIPGNGIDDDGNGYIDDVHGIDLIENDSDPMDDMGHGTHVAGIIAMTPGNGNGVGLAYGANIMCIKAGQANGSFASSDIAKAVKYAADNGADVINMSFGGTGKSALVEAALKDAFSTCVLVASAGNDGLPTNDAKNAGYMFTEDIYPAGYDYVIGVMASDISDNLASFSNWDFKPDGSCEYEMTAPGVGIYSTLPNNRYASWSGTSMSAPMVSAAAAIIRSEYTNKSKYTSRYIMGQLTSATGSKIDFTGLLGDFHSYPRLNIKDSLKYQPKPDLRVKNIYTFDNQELSAVNNNDGIAQPGEIIDLGFELWNRWGTATDITVKIDALSAGGVENPYVEFITDEINLQDVGTFATVNNGYTYTDGMLTSVSNPLRFKIKEGTPNDAQITFNITVTASNGMDTKDKNNYGTSTQYTLLIQNGQTLSGVIKEDMTLTADKYWIIENNVLIPEGVTVTVEPGTQIQFWTADPSNPYASSANVFLKVEGRLIAEGTEERPIEMFPGKGCENKPVTILSIQEIASDREMIDSDYSKSYAFLKYVNIINASLNIKLCKCQ